MIETSRPLDNRAQLRQLFILRNLAIGAQVATIVVASWYFQMSLPLAVMVGAIAALALFNFWTFVRVNTGAVPADRELFGQLSVDVAVLTVLLGASGGATNPFAILYLLPLALAATILPARLTWAMAGLTVAAYSALMFYHAPFPHSVLDHESAFGLHVLGMWIGFVAGAAVVTHFILRMRSIIKAQSASLLRAREEALHNEQLVRLGVLAASTAHEISTPLNSASLLLEDIDFEEAQDLPSLHQKTDAIRAQLGRCRDALEAMSRSAGTIKLHGGREVSLVPYLDELLTAWRRAHPDLEITLNAQIGTGSPTILADELLRQALVNILDNAREASPDAIHIDTAWDTARWHLTIRDFGPGLTPEAREQVGERGYSTKPHGMGLGLYLTHQVIKRLGGVVNLYNHDQGGLCTCISMPLHTHAASR